MWLIYMWSNPWVVGIGGGIISGIAVFFVTNFVFSKISKKDYFRKINKANQEVIELIIMSVSEGKIPTIITIQSILSSLARKYSIKPKDMNDIKDTLEDIVKEVFSTNFIPIDKKIEISNSIDEMIQETYEPQVSEEIPQTISNNRSFQVLMSLVLTVIFMFMFLIMMKEFVFSDNSTFTFMITFVTLILVLMSLTLISIKQKEVRNKVNKGNKD